MKRLAVLSITILLSASIIQGQAQKTEKETKKEAKAERVALKKLEGANVSAIAKNSFSEDFKNTTNPQWKRLGTFDEVAFTKDGKELKAFYDIDGKLVGTTQRVTFADMPARGQKEIKEKYKDYTVGPVIFYDDNEANETDMILYGLQFDDEDNYFVELTNGTKKIIVHVNKEGTFFFKEL